MPVVGGAETDDWAHVMLKKQLDRLSTLSAAVERSVNGAAASPALSRSLGKTGRFSRRPNYQNWTINGTRPQSDRGVTFHFKHSFVTKGRHQSNSYSDETSAAAHQSYIERNGAVETTNLPLPETDDPHLDAATEFMDRSLHVAGEERPISFGTIGHTKSERVEFWRKVERTEGRRGRVQHRIIAELPYELDAGSRELIARDFAKIFEDKGLPFWCTLHAPSGHNDARNYHLHMAYYDRPARRGPDGTWDFEIVSTVRYANGQTATKRPHKQNKDRTVQGKAWVKSLRRRFSDVSNYHLSLTGTPKRYDPRSYRESGVEKSPTIHLGTKASVSEVYGLDTRPGVENTRRELSFRLAAGERNFRDRIRHIDHIIKRLEPVGSDSDEIVALKRAAHQKAQLHLGLSREGVEVWQKKEVHEIGLEAVTKRLGKRRAFLDNETNRLFGTPPAGREDEAWSLGAALHNEALLIDEAGHDLRPFVDACERVVSAQTRRLAGIDNEQLSLLSEIFEIERSVISLSAGMDPTEQTALITQTQHSYELAFGISAHKDQAGPPAHAPSAGTISARHQDSASSPATYDRPEARTSEGSGTAEPSPTDQPTSVAPNGRNRNLQAIENRRRPDSEADPEMEAIRAMLGDHHIERRGTQVFPDAIAFPVDPSPEAIRKFENEIAGLTNAQLRARTLATRDATDLSTDPELKAQYRTSYVVMRDIAERRGLDLATGIHDPRRALDPQMAIQHLDSEQQPVPYQDERDRVR